MLNRTAIMSLSVLLGAASVSGDTIVNLTSVGQGLGPNTTNVGTSWTVLDSLLQPTILSLSARAQIDPTNTQTTTLVPSIYGEVGTVIFVHDTRKNKFGAGVQNGAGGGSKEISGHGPNGNEELSLNFATSVFADSVVVDFSLIELGSGIGDMDDPVVFVIKADLTWQAFTETQWGSAFTAGAGKTGSLDIGALFADPFLKIKNVVVRETKGHSLVGGVGFDNPPAVPLPSSAALAFAGLIGLGSARRRRSV